MMNRYVPVWQEGETAMVVGDLYGHWYNCALNAQALESKCHTKVH